MFYSTIYGVDIYTGTTTICVLETEIGVTAVGSFRGNVYGTTVEWSGEVTGSILRSV